MWFIRIIFIIVDSNEYNLTDIILKRLGIVPILNLLDRRCHRLIIL